MSYIIVQLKQKSFAFVLVCQCSGWNTCLPRRARKLVAIAYFGRFVFTNLVKKVRHVL